MGVPIVQNTQTASNIGASSGSVVITKPTGLAVGDLMVACIAHWAGGTTRTLTTPTNWTSQQKADGADGNLALYTKVADSADVAASNFTFSASASGDCMAGTLSRITGYSSIGASEYDISNGGTASYSHTTALTPSVINNLLLTFFMGCDATWTGTPSASTYTSTPTETFVEIADVGVKSGTNGLCVAVVTADNTGTTQWTARGVTYNDTVAGQEGSVALIIEGIVDVLGTNELLTISPTLFNQNGVGGTTGTNSLLSVSPNLPTQSGIGTEPTVWTLTAKP